MRTAAPCVYLLQYPASKTQIPMGAIEEIVVNSVRSLFCYSVLWHPCHLIAENFLYKYELYLSH